MTITHDTQLMPIGKQIAFWRKKKGLTKTDLAKKIDLSFTAISAIEREDYKPSTETLNKICEVLSLRYDPLILREK